MNKPRNAGGRSPAAVVRALVDKLYPNLDGRTPKTVVQALVDRFHASSGGHNLLAVVRTLAFWLQANLGSRTLLPVVRALVFWFHANLGGRTPMAAVRVLAYRFHPNSVSHVWPRTSSGKVLTAVAISGAIVAVGNPLFAGAGQAPAPAPAPPPAQAAVQAPVPAPPSAPEVPPQPVAKSVSIHYQKQQTEYWCGPTATRIALSSQTSQLPDQRALAALLGTTVDGTDHIGQVVDGLNKQLAGTGVQYVTRNWNGRSLTPEMKQELWSDTIRNVDAGRAMVANIVAKPSNRPPGYPSGETIYHYVAVVGYNTADGTVHIADPARFSGIEDYWLGLDQLASLIQPKGYAA